MSSISDKNKYLYVNRNMWPNRAILPRHEDVRPIVTERGVGCDGRGGAQTMCIAAYGQAVWSCPLDAGVKLIEMINRRRRLTSPILRGDHGAAVQPLRRECRVISADL